MVATAFLVGPGRSSAPKARVLAEEETNLLIGDQTTFSGSVGTWVPVTDGATLAHVDSPSRGPDPGAAEISTQAAGPLDVWVVSGADASHGTTATAGHVYSARIAVRAGSTPRSVGAFAAFYDDGGDQLGAVFGQATTDAGDWSLTPTVVGLAPPGTTSVLFGLVFYGTQAGETHYVDDATLTEQTVSTPAVHGPLHVSGTQIVDAGGQPVTLRGINRDGVEWTTPNFPTDAEIGQARAWGANFVRVFLNEKRWLNTCTSTRKTNDPKYPGKVDAVVGSITSRGMVALLDLHFNVTSSCRSAGPQAMADALFAPKFWGQVAARYKNNPLVAFDLYNEPHDISDGVWRNGGTATYGGVSFKAAGMQTLYNAVRAQGATNLVFISGPDWADRPAATAVTGTNIVNAAHVYTCTEPSLTSCTGSDPYSPDALLSNWNGSARPVVVTEFGWPQNTSGTYIENVIAFAESKGWGWAAFAWDGGTSSPFSLVGGTGSAYEPSPAGIPVLAGLQNG